MSANPVWHNDIERDAWIEKHCRICFQPDEALKRVTGSGDGCPHLARAEQNKMPTPWTRRRNAVMGETYRCSEFRKQPAVNRRRVCDIDPIPMITEEMLERTERNLVPVDGWPDYLAEQRKSKEGDHQ